VAISFIRDPEQGLAVWFALDPELVLLPKDTAYKGGMEYSRLSEHLWHKMMKFMLHQYF
jgi:hypothetical protein